MTTRSSRSAGSARSLRRAMALAAVTAAAAMSMLAGCGSADHRATAQHSQPRFDRSLHQLLPASIRDRGSLTVGTDPSYAPMSSFGADGRTIVGVEPDLGAQLSRVLGVKVRFVDTAFTSLLPRVADGRLDLAMSAITDTRRREGLVDFVNYFSAGTAIVVQRGNPEGVTDIKDLCGKVVAVERGTTQVDLLARTQANCAATISVRSYPTNSDALVQLRTGRAVAVLNDLPPAALLVSDRRTASQYQLASTTQYEPGLYGVAVDKHDLRLRDAVQGALEKLVRHGWYRDVLRRWGVQQGAVDDVTVNSGI